MTKGIVVQCDRHAYSGYLPPHPVLDIASATGTNSNQPAVAAFSVGEDSCSLSLRGMTVVKQAQADYVRPTRPLVMTRDMSRAVTAAGEWSAMSTQPRLLIADIPTRLLFVNEPQKGVSGLRSKIGLRADSVSLLD